MNKKESREDLMHRVYFKAISKSGDWVYGFPVFDKVGDDFVAYMLTHVAYDRVLYGDKLYGKIVATGIDHERVAIDPATICQYVGASDKNGRDIYEGDVFPHPCNPQRMYQVEVCGDCICPMFCVDTGFEPDCVEIVRNEYDENRP